MSRKDKRIRLGFMGGGPTGVNALGMLRLIDTGNEDVDFHLRKVFKTVRVWVDPMRKSKTRYIKHYLDMAEPGNIMEAAALEMGFPREHVIRERYDPDQKWRRIHDPDRILEVIRDAEIQALIVVSYGFAVEREIIEAVNGNCFILHPTGPLPVDSKVIPEKFRGAVVVEKMAELGIPHVPMHIAMIKAEPVENKADPADWDKGKKVGQSPVFLGPYFTHADRVPERLSFRVREIQSVMSTAYGLTLLQLPRALDITPKQLVEEYKVPKNRVRSIFGYKPEELRDSDLLKPEKKKKK